MKVLVTGTAGFIGHHLVKALAKLKDTEIVGIDNINDYYPVELKYTRLEESGVHKEMIHRNSLVDSDFDPNYKFGLIDLCDYEVLDSLFDTYHFDVVINLAAQAGVRYSLEQPMKYIQSNVVGFTHILECCRHHQVRHLLYASSSSVYGMNNKTPFSEDDNVDYPVSLYAATKKSNELLAHTYSHLYKLPTTGLRFFTVYGPWGRPDMAPILFAKAITTGKPIKLFNGGDMLRDFTYVTDVVEAVVKLIPEIPGEDSTHPYYRILNIGHSDPVRVTDFLKTLENALGVEAKLDIQPMQPGDVPVTYADTAKLQELIGYKPATSLEEGIGRFVDWFRHVV